MSLYEFFENYRGDACISIDGYCEEEGLWAIVDCDWYDDIKFRIIDNWSVIGGGMYPVEICITLA